MALRDVSKKVWIASAIIVAIVLVSVLYFYLIRKSEEPTEKSTEEILNQLTAPEGMAEPISEALQESLTAPENSAPPKDDMEDILSKLTAPE